MMSGMTLTDFLLARIAEDEAAARDIPAGSWEDACDTTHRYDHVFRWSPERVLAECEAKRLVVEAAQQLGGGGDFAGGAATFAELALQSLAWPHREHPDFRPDWGATPHSAGL